MIEDNILSFLNVYFIGFGGGIALSVLPLIIGEIINLGLKILKGGS